MPERTRPTLPVTPTDNVLEEWYPPSDYATQLQTLAHRLVVTPDGDLWVQVAYTWGGPRDEPQNIIWVSCVNPAKHLIDFCADTRKRPTPAPKPMRKPALRKTAKKSPRKSRKPTRKAPAKRK